MRNINSPIDDYFLQSAIVFEEYFDGVEMRKNFEDRPVAFVGGLLSSALAFVAIFAVSTSAGLISIMLSDNPFNNSIEYFIRAGVFWIILALLVYVLWIVTANLVDNSVKSRLRCLTYHLIMPLSVTCFAIYFSVFVYKDS